jgi:hypothetical protein
MISITVQLGKNGVNGDCPIIVPTGCDPGFVQTWGLFVFAFSLFRPSTVRIPPNSLCFYLLTAASLRNVVSEVKCGYGKTPRES